MHIPKKKGNKGDKKYIWKKAPVEGQEDRMGKRNLYLKNGKK